MLSLYPPLFFQRVRVVAIEPGFRACRVRVERSLLTRNLNGTTFGGSIFSAADPNYAVMYWQIFARRGEVVQSWLKSAAIRYRKPAATALTLEFRLDEPEIEAAAADLREAGRFDRSYLVEAVDRTGEVCARVETLVHVRYPGSGQREVSGF